MAAGQMNRMVGDMAWLTYPLHILVGIIKMLVYTALFFLLLIFIFFLWMFTAHDQRAELTRDFTTQQTVFRVDPLSNAVTVQKQGSKIVCGQKVDGVNRAFDPDTELAPDAQPIYGHDVSYNTIVVGGKLKDSCYEPSPIPAATVAKAFGGAADNGSFIKNAGWFDHQWLSEKSDAFDFAYIKSARSLRALQIKLYENVQNPVVSNVPVVYMSFLPETDRDRLFQAAEFRGNWFTGMCLAGANCTDADFVPRNTSIFYDAVAPQMTANQDAAVKALYATGSPEFWIDAAHVNGIYGRDAEFASAAKDNQSAMAASLKFSEPSTDEFVHEVAFGVGCYFAFVVLLCVCVSLSIRGSLRAGNQQENWEQLMQIGKPLAEFDRERDIDI